MDSLKGQENINLNQLHYARKDDGIFGMDHWTSSSQMEAKTPDKEKCIQSAISKFK